MMVAKVTNLEVGEFVHTLGDAHIYDNHLEQIKLQLSRTPKPLPKMIITRDTTNILDFEYGDFKLVDYQSHPAIKGAVAV